MVETESSIPQEAQNFTAPEGVPKKARLVKRDEIPVEYKQRHRHRSPVPSRSSVGKGVGMVNEWRAGQAAKPSAREAFAGLFSEPSKKPVDEMLSDDGSEESESQGH